MKALSKAKFVFLIALCFFALVLTACKGVEIAPGDGGSVTVTPIDPDKDQTGGGGNHNIHSHVYQRDDSSLSFYDCTKGGTITMRCYCGATMTENVVPTNHTLRFYEGKAPTCTTGGYNAYEECINPNCNYSTYSELAATNHIFVSYEAKEATCTEFGWAAYEICKKCSYSTYVKTEARGHKFVNGFCACGQKDLGLHEHKWDSGVIVTNATCTVAGSKKFTCLDANCQDTKIVEITALGHDITHYEAKAATCTASGYYAYDECKLCDYTTYVVTPALGHNIRSMIGVAATCTSDGYSDYEICTRAGCNGESLKKKTVIPALDHDLSYLPNVAATCTTLGLKDRAECKRAGCGYKTEMTVSALGHSLQHYDGKSATCTEDGYNAYDDCSRCDYSTYLVIKALGHDDVKHEAKEPTCTEFGWNAYSVCKRCSHSTYAERAALGHALSNGQCSRCDYFDDGSHSHVWNDGYITTNPTCTATGVKEYTCTYDNCGDTKTESVSALGHDNTHYNKKDATCTEDGYYAYDVCNRCGYSTFVKISALGHKYDNGMVITQPTCTGKGVRRYSCERGGCNKTYDVDVDPTGHEWGNWFVAKDATCTASGQKQQICFNNSAHVNYETIPAHGHEWGDYIVQKVATCIEQGEMLRYCVHSCGTKTPVEPIPVIKHNINSQGVCIICKQIINPPLAAPIISDRNGDTIFWSAVSGAVSYELKIICNGVEENVSTTATSYNLAKYHLECSELKVYIRSMSAAGSNTANSEYSEYLSIVEPGTVVDHGGVGESVNLLTGPYTDFENGSKLSIFNEHVFNRLNADDYSGQTPKHHTETIYSESIRDYTNQLTEKNNNKLSIDASVGAANLIKVSAGYTYEVGTSYEKKSYSNTQAIFYDINYTYTRYQTGIKSYITTLFLMLNNGTDEEKAEAEEILLTLTSESFRKNAENLQNGHITPADFIDLYGTHVIIEGIYGASFKAHYEYLSDKTSASTTFGDDIKHTITAGIAANLSGVKTGVDVENINQTITSSLSDSNTSDVYSKFTFDALGGDIPADLTAVSFSEFHNVCANWIAAVAGVDENGLSRYDLIDVPDGSLYFVWDFLGDEYAEAKDILENYFYAVCDEQYKLNNSKINGMYQDFFDFDDETGTLLIDLSARQNPNSGNVSLAGAEYKDGSSVIFDGTTFTIYPKFNGKVIEKVIFKGGYMTRDYLTDQLITNYFTDLCIEFDDDWNEDIIVEFQNFGFKATLGKDGVDFSQTSSKNIGITIKGDAIIEKSDYTEDVCFDAITYASGQNIAIAGEELLEVKAGKKIDATAIVVFSVENGNRNKFVTDSDGVYDDVEPALRKNELAQLGYNKIKVTIEFDIKEVYDGYQDLWIISNNGQKKHSFEYNSAGGLNWTHHFAIFELNFSDLGTNGEFKLEWGANGTGEDTWAVGYTYIAITAIR